MPNNISRRDVLKTLTIGVSSGSVLRMIPLQAAEQVHQMVREERAQTSAGGYTPKFFPAHSYQTLRSLCQTIIPPDEKAGGALEAGAPEFIDLLTSENQEYQMTLGGGLAWLDSTCNDRYGKVFLECAAAQQTEVLDQIAYRENAQKDPALGPGVKFFSLLRDLTTDGFFTSEIGIKYLEYIGNTYLAEFPGCPPLPEG
ncbi:MAG TPA: gluconate 2-dehydrogenase subunit 3 family protein [Terriglobia bacterium]|nr:gluconate 2-dehydrogenase subunit 3 family protein [Terriglobia bacterium]